MMMSAAPGLHSGSSSVTNAGENIHNFNVMSPSAMSPSAMSYLLEVIAADINRTEDLERYRRNSGAAVRLPSGERPSVESQKQAVGDDHRLPSVATLLAASTSTVQPTFTYNSSIPNHAKNMAPVASTLADVTNNKELTSLGDHNANINKPRQPPPKVRTTPQRPRKRTIDEDDDDIVETRRSKKKSRSSSSEDDCSQTPSRRRSSTRSVPSPAPNSPTPSDVSTAVVPPTVKDADDTTGAEDDKAVNKKSRSRRFKEDELTFLDAVFKTEPYPDPMITERLSIQLEVSEHRIKVWFANRRHRQARDKVQKMTNMMAKKDELVTETAAVPTETSLTSPAFLSSVPPAYTPQYGMVPTRVPSSGCVYGYSHPSTIPSAIPKHPIPHMADFARSAEARLRAQIASTIQSRFPYSSPALLQLANQTMLSRSGLNQYQPLHYPMTSSLPSGAVPSGDICDLTMPRRRPASGYVYVEPPILPPLTAESTSYTDGIDLSPAISKSPSPWHWMP